MHLNSSTVVAVIKVFIFFVMILATPAFFHAYSQEPSGEVLKQLEKKETLPKEEPEKEVPVIKKQEEKEAPQVTGGPKVYIKAFKIEGATIFDQANLNTVISSYQEKELTLSEINQAADAITAAYRQRGYLIANAFIPAQDIKDGVVIIKVVEGKIGNITIAGNENYTTEFIRGHIEKIKQDPSLKEQTLTRSLLLLNDYPSLNVFASLKAGTEPGATDVAIAALDTYPIISGSLSYDNFGTTTLSKHRAILSLDIGNLATSGDLLMLRGVTGLDTIDINKLSYGRIEYSIPIDYNGTKTGIYYANSLYEAGENLTPLVIKGEANIAGIYITNPIIKTIDTTLSLKLAFDYKDIYDYILYTQRSQDKIRTGSLGATYDTTDNLYLSARNLLSLNYFRGMGGGFLGGTGANDKNTSRLHANGEFNKYTLDAVRIQKLPGYNLIVIRGSGQYSSDPLFIAEQSTIGGAGSVRGFNPSSSSGDSGYNVTAELQLSPLFAEETLFNQKIGDTIKVALFADHGGVFRNDLQPGEAQDDYLASVGVGIRLYYQKSISVRVDYAIPEIKGDFNTGKSETYIQAALSF